MVLAMPRGLERSAAVVLLLAVAAAYASSFAGGFQFDDFNVIVDDSSVQSLSAWWHVQPSIRPLLKLSYARDVNGLGCEVDPGQRHRAACRDRETQALDLPSKRLNRSEIN